MAGSIAWRHDVDAALAEARAAGKPLFLYWGAVWCPPCNRVKADIFALDEFAAQMSRVVPVWLDGGVPGAQAMAERLRLRSYPTLVLYSPAGAEVTRLPCELDGEAFVAALAAALAAGPGAAEILARSPELSAAEWALLSHYSWDTDEGTILQGRDAHTVLTALAQACPVPDAATRLRLLALSLQPDPSAAPWLLALCGDARLARANMDILNNSGGAIVRQSGNVQVAAALAQTVQAWADDMWLSRSDRLMAVRLQARMVRLGHVQPDMPARVRAAIAEALAEADSPYERHALVNTAISAFNDAGLHEEAQALAEAEVTTSALPYYFMLSLTTAARRRGDTAAMLDWYERAWRASTGSATRLQWGATYLLALVENAAPADRIEQAAVGIAADVAATPDAFRQRNRAQLIKVKSALAAGSGPQSAALMTLPI